MSETLLILFTGGVVIGVFYTLAVYLHDRKARREYPQLFERLNRKEKQ